MKPGGGSIHDVGDFFNGIDSETSQDWVKAEWSEVQRYP